MAVEKSRLVGRMEAEEVVVVVVVIVMEGEEELVLTTLAVVVVEVVVVSLMSICFCYRKSAQLLIGRRIYICRRAICV